MAKKPPAGKPEREETEAQREQRKAEELLERDHQNQRRPQTPPPDLAEAVRERDEYLDLAQRTKADFENYRKRVAKETAEALVRGKAELARGLIPVVDNLERALRAAGVEESGEPSGTSPEAPSEEVSAHEALARGVALVHQELRGTLEGAGVEAYDPAGERFDPETCEALATRPAEDSDSGLVLETVEKGYRLDGQVLRPARVVVSE